MKLFPLQILTGALLLMSCSACEFPSSLSNWINQDPAVRPEVSATPTEEALSSSAAKKAKANSEIFHEMFVVIFMREPKDRSEFGNWVDTLNQGASLEGIYNGLTHSEDYRNLEKTSPKASERAVKVFREEVTFLEAELPTPTQLGNFGLASIFLLKRVLSDEALKVIASKNAVAKNPGLAAWYAKWAVHMTQRNVDFGVTLRNKADEAFHLKWATEVSEDQIVWEVLNRLHRVLNDANK
ncbi:MAG: hypothetical protein ABIQ95_12650 [Bdellovibrionia bacterium]